MAVEPAEHRVPVQRERVGILDAETVAAEATALAGLAARAEFQAEAEAAVRVLAV